MCMFLEYGINSILFQRGIYPSSYFQSVVKYGISVMVTEDEKINEFLQNVFQQVEGMFHFAEPLGAQIGVKEIPLVVTKIRF